MKPVVWILYEEVAMSHLLWQKMLLFSPKVVTLGTSNKDSVSQIASTHKPVAKINLQSKPPQNRTPDLSSYEILRRITACLHNLECISQKFCHQSWEDKQVLRRVRMWPQTLWLNLRRRHLRQVTVRKEMATWDASVKISTQSTCSSSRSLSLNLLRTLQIWEAVEALVQAVWIKIITVAYQTRSEWKEPNKIAVMTRHGRWIKDLQRVSTGLAAAISV